MKEHKLTKVKLYVPLGIGILFGALATNMRLPGEGLSDAFHFGEYFVSEINLRQGEADKTFVMIHGLVDIVPAKLNHLLFGSGSYVLSTWFSYQFLNILAAFAFCHFFIRKTSPSILAPTLLFPLGVFAAGTVGYRDIFLILLLLCIPNDFAMSRTRANSHLLLFVTGFVALICCYWAWNRGLIGLMILSIYLLFIIRHLSNFLFVFLGAATAQLMTLFVIPSFGVNVFFENVTILSKTASEWSLPLYLTWKVLLEVTLWSILFAFVFIKKIGFHPLISKDNLRIIMSTLLLCGGVQWVIGRADNSHLISFYWIVLLLIITNLEQIRIWKSTKSLIIGLMLLFTLMHLISREWTFSLLLNSFRLIVCKLLNFRIEHNFFFRLGSGFLMAVAFIIIWNAGSKSYAWTDYILSKADDSSLVARGIDWSSDKILDSKSNCVFDFTNSGLINALVQKPTCTSFGYIVYANMDYEERIISELALSKPRVIVSSADYWSFAIDGRPMTERFPNLESYIRKYYSEEDCKYGYCVKYLKN